MNFSEKLSKLIFLEVKSNELEKLLKTKLNCEEGVFIPIDAAYISNNINNENKIGNIPMSQFIDGMVLILGCDSKFKYNDIYIKILCNIPDAFNYIKEKIATLVKKNMLEDAYITIKALMKLEFDEEIFEKALILLEELRAKQQCFRDEELELIEKLKMESISPIPHFYESLVYRDDEEYERALISLQEYFNRGGEKSSEILEFNQWLKNSCDYKNAKDMLYEDPKKALELLIPLIDIDESNALLHYHIAIAYRLLENYEKAIYYLNEALALDEDIVEIINELGLNYASLEDYDNAIKYFNKAFQVTNEIGICTNLAMCYLKLNKIKEAQACIEKGETIDKEDEILIEIKKTLKRN